MNSSFHNLFLLLSTHAWYTLLAQLLLFLAWHMQCTEFIAISCNRVLYFAVPNHVHAVDALSPIYKPLPVVCHRCDTIIVYIVITIVECNTRKYNMFIAEYCYECEARITIPTAMNE